MSEPLRAHEPEEHDPSEHLGGVQAAGQLSLVEPIERPAQRRGPLPLVLMGALLLANLYLWLGNPSWLTLPEPPAPSIEYSAGSWKIAVWLQRQRIEEYRRVNGELPVAASQAGPTVHGVRYTPIDGARAYRLVAGEGPRTVVYRSTDPPTVLMDRTLAQAGLVAGRVR
jgi:hypothetical protein